MLGGSPSDESLRRPLRGDLQATTVTGEPTAVTKRLLSPRDRPSAPERRQSLARTPHATAVAEQDARPPQTTAVANNATPAPTDHRRQAKRPPPRATTVASHNHRRPESPAKVPALTRATKVATKCARSPQGDQSRREDDHPRAKPSCGDPEGPRSGKDGEAASRPPSREPPRRRPPHQRWGATKGRRTPTLRERPTSRPRSSTCRPRSPYHSPASPSGRPSPPRTPGASTARSSCRRRGPSSRGLRRRPSWSWIFRAG